jgi:hypothetical protein
VSRQTRQSRVFKWFTHINLYRDVCALWTDVHIHMTRQTRQSRVFRWFTHINLYRDVCALWTDVHIHMCQDRLGKAASSNCLLI